jgi:sterol desaturase/sphingolipid hydroxylase (fatty acid hydroxylase superfamily)
MIFANNFGNEATEINMVGEKFILTHEPMIRLGFFLSIFLLIALWELIRPSRILKMPKLLRWSNNLALVVLNTALLRFIFPLASVGIATFCLANGWGLLNYFKTPSWLAVPLAVIALDFAIWLQHVLVHAVPLLWRLHRVHHADLDFDLTTGSRFHPIEIVVSMLIKIAAIAIIGPPVVAVVIFEVLLNATAMFNHGNIRLPASLDRIARWIVVTPDMHRVHHSVAMNDSNSNFGFNLTWWDRVFGTYREQPEAGRIDMTIGLHGHTDPREVTRLDGMLLMPFRRES